jgi:hypothetical protein
VGKEALLLLQRWCIRYDDAPPRYRLWLDEVGCVIVEGQNRPSSHRPRRVCVYTRCQWIPRYRGSRISAVILHIRITISECAAAMTVEYLARWLASRIRTSGPEGRGVRRFSRVAGGRLVGGSGASGLGHRSVDEPRGKAAMAHGWQRKSTPAKP